jgi:TRAP-type C4-dicarboxylate transport system substrate-binding protein
MPSNPTSVKAWEQLGCAATVIPYTETYLALKQGTVDALTCPVVDAYLFKFCEVAPYLTITYEYPQQVAAVMNNRAFQKLTPEQQAILLDEFDKAGDYVTEQALTKSDEIIQKMKDEYHIEMIETDLTPWRAQMEPFIKELEKSDYIPAGYVEKIRAIQ